MGAAVSDSTGYKPAAYGGACVEAAGRMLFLFYHLSVLHREQMNHLFCNIQPEYVAIHLLRLFKFLGAL